VGDAKGNQRNADDDQNQAEQAFAQHIQEGHEGSSVTQGGQRSTVGASLLAKVVNDGALILNECGALGFFASKLAPTGVSRSSGSYLLISATLNTCSSIGWNT
jgi:hypothetical protein